MGQKLVATAAKRLDGLNKLTANQQINTARKLEDIDKRVHAYARPQMIPAFAEEKYGRYNYGSFKGNPDDLDNRIEEE